MKRIAKENLPRKICPVCGLYFSWRKKWELNWNDIRYCSDRCRKNRGECKHRDKKDA